MEPSTITLEELKATIANYKRQLAAAEQQMKILYPDEGRIYTVNKDDVLALAKNDTAAFNKAWKKIVDEDLVKNIQNILEECHYYIINYDNNEEFVEKAKKKMGAINSKEWASFTLEVITYLKNQGSFGDPSSKYGLDNFEDTAGGCDEITHDAVVDIIKKI